MKKEDLLVLILVAVVWFGVLISSELEITSSVTEEPIGYSEPTIEEYQTTKIPENVIKKREEIEIKNNKELEYTNVGKIKFKEEFTLESINVDENQNVHINYNIIAINTAELPELNKPATINFYNLIIDESPRIYYSEKFTTNLNEITEPCPEDICYNINYDKETKTLTFDVSHFSSFAVSTSTQFCHTQSHICTRHDTCPLIYPIRCKGENPQSYIDQFGRTCSPILSTWCRQFDNGIFCYNGDVNFGGTGTHYWTSVKYCCANNPADCCEINTYCEWNGGELINDNGNVYNQYAKNYLIGEKICFADTKTWKVCGTNGFIDAVDSTGKALSCYECSKDHIDYKIDKCGENVNAPLCEVDLFVADVKPIQVIENVKLIENKPTMVRVAVDFKAKPEMVNVTKNIDVYLYYGAALVGKLQSNVIKRGIYDTAMWYKRIVEYEGQTDKELIDILLEEYIDTLKKIKKGEDTLNFFNIRVWKETNTFRVIVDPLNIIKETYDADSENNNEKTKEVQVIEKNYFTVLPVYVFVQDAPEPIHQDKIDTAVDMAKENYEFLRKVYPLDPTKTKLLKGVVIREEANIELIEGEIGNKISQEEARRNVRMRIFRELQKLADKNKINLVIGVVYPERILMVEGGQISGYSIPCATITGKYTEKSCFDNVVLLRVPKRSQINEGVYSVTAHEFGHLKGLYFIGAEQYTKFPVHGLLASNGWCLDQDTGKSCIHQVTGEDSGPRINVWTKIPEGGFISHDDYYEQGPIKTRVDGRYYDIMGRGEQVWIAKDPTYNELMRKL